MHSKITEFEIDGGNDAADASFDVAMFHCNWMGLWNKKNTHGSPLYKLWAHPHGHEMFDINYTSATSYKQTIILRVLISPN